MIQMNKKLSNFILLLIIGCLDRKLFFLTRRVAALPSCGTARGWGCDTGRVLAMTGAAPSAGCNLESGVPVKSLTTARLSLQARCGRTGFCFSRQDCAGQSPPSLGKSAATAKRKIISIRGIGDVVPKRLMRREPQSSPASAV